MRGSKTKLLCYLFFLICYCAEAQLIQSKLLDFETKEPILGATVYFDGTTNGTITNGTGVFKIRKKTGINSNLIISCLGYQKMIIDLDTITNDDHIIFLKPQIEALDDLVITKDNWSREKKLKYFKREFLGQMTPTDQCFIENEEDIKIRYNAETQELTAHSKQTIIIKNKTLGYTIKYDLSDFTIQLEENLFYKTHFVKEVYYLGTSFFISNKERKKHRKARNNVYNGSILHFMRSIKGNKIEENGFLIFYDKFQVKAQEYIQYSVEIDKIRVFLKEERISILYKRDKQSFLVTNTENHSFYINDFGNHFPSENISFGGYLGEKRIATMLPLDYKYSSTNTLQ